MNRRLAIALIFCLLGGSAWAWLTARRTDATSDPRLAADYRPAESSLRIIPNQGQWDLPVRYLTRLRGGTVLYTDRALYYNFFDLPTDTHGHVDDATHPHAAEEKVVREHVVRVGFEGAGTPQLVAGDKQRGHHNYFYGQDTSKWASRVPLFGELTYRQLYPGVDLKLYGAGDALKYDFLVEPGADPDQIRLNYEGADRLFLKNGNLHVETSIRSFVESAPFAFQIIDGQKQEVMCRYKLVDDVLRFEFPRGYDSAYPLVIDPSLIFSTYTGSRSDNWGFTATYDEAGAFYAGGIVFNGSGINPRNYNITPGAYQSNFNGGISDAAITKYTPDGTAMLYSTYLGGSDDDQPHSLFVGSQGELYVFGRTASSDFPVTGNSYDPTHNGDNDIFVVRFNAAGDRITAGTFVGGSGSDAENGFWQGSTSQAGDIQRNYGDDARGEIVLDENDNVFIAACTKSANFPTTGNAIRQTFGGGPQDGVVLRLTPDLRGLRYSTFLGGSDDDAAYSMKLDSKGNMIVTGGTQSRNFPTTGGVLNPTYLGNIDGFITKINILTGGLVASTFVGTSVFDQAYLLEIDEDDNIYVAGLTEGNYPVSSGAWSIPGGSQFIAKFNEDLDRRLLSTVFGRSGSNTTDLSLTAFLVDVCDNIYVAGWGGPLASQGSSTLGLPTTPDAIQRTTDGSDFYMIVLERDAQNLLYGTFLGGNNVSEHVDGGTSRFNREGIVYHAVCAGCGGSDNFPTTPGVVSETNGSLNCNLAAFKIEFNLTGVEARFAPKDQNNQPLTVEGCAPLSVRFDNQSSLPNPGNTSIFWDFGDGNQVNTKNPGHTFQVPGTYQVRLVVEDLSTCNLRDTAFATITVLPPPTADAGLDTIICRGDTVSLRGSGVGTQGTYQWTGSNVFSPNQSTTNAAPPGDQNYVLEVTDDKGCKARDTMEVAIDRSLQVAVREDTTVCEGVSLRLGGATNGISWEWSPAQTLSDATDLFPIATPDTTTHYVLTAVNARGCEEKDSVRVEMYEVYTVEDTSICIGDTFLLRTTNGVTFRWSPNYNLSDSTRASPRAWPRVDTTYRVFAVSRDGCTSEKDVDVVVNPLPIPEAGDPVEICIGDTGRFSASGGVIYRWEPAEFVVGQDSSAQPRVNPPETQQFDVTVIDANGCKAFDSVVATIYALPRIEAGPSTKVCEGNSIELFATGGVRYEWFPDPTLSAFDIPNPLATPTQASLYFVTGFDANGCSNDTFVSLDITRRPEVEISALNYICVGGQLELTAETDGDRVEWNTGSEDFTIRVVPTQPTLYVVTPFDGVCDGTPDSIVADQFFGYPEARFEPDRREAFAPGDVVFTNASLDATRYEWNFGDETARSIDESPKHTYARPGTFPVRLIAFSSTGCADTAFDEIFLENVRIFVPSAFTPNGDNSNEHFRVGQYGIQSLRVEIYSRWGLLLYESDQIDFAWDGRYQGQDMPEGVYVYKIRAVGENNQIFRRNGTVTLIR